MVASTPSDRPIDARFPEGFGRGIAPASAGELALIEELSAERIARGGRVWRRIVSDSMAPALLRGDRILVERCDPARVRPGDIVVFRAPAGLMAHRALAVRRRGASALVLQKGDANPFAGTISGEGIVGRVCRIGRDGREIDPLHGSGRRAQVAAAWLSLRELGLYALGRAIRRALGVARPTGLAGHLIAALRCAAQAIVRRPGQR